MKVITGINYGLYLLMAGGGYWLFWTCAENLLIRICGTIFLIIWAYIIYGMASDK